MFSTGDRTTPVNTDEPDMNENQASDLLLPNGLLAAQKDIEKETENDIEKESENEGTITPKSKEQQDALVSGVAQIANIGSIISSTFTTFNDKFTKFDEIIKKSVSKQDDIGGEFKKQGETIEYLEQSVDDIKLQMGDIFSAVRQLELQMATRVVSEVQTAVVEVQKIAAEVQGSITPQIVALQGVTLGHEREDLMRRVYNLEDEVKLVKQHSFKEVDDGEPIQVVSTEKAALEVQRSELLQIVAALEKKIEANELLLLSFKPIAQKPIVVAKIEETIIEEVSEPLEEKDPMPIAARKVSIEDLQQMFLNADLRSDSKLEDRVEKVEKLLSAQEVLQEKLNSSIMMSMSNANMALEEAQRVQIMALAEAQSQGRRVSIDVRRASVDFKRVKEIPESEPQQPLVDYSAINKRHEVAIEELQLLVATLKAEHAAEKETSDLGRETSVAALEKSNDRIIYLENSAALNHGTFLAQIKDMGERLSDLQDGAQSSLGSSLAIKRLQLAMNDVIAECDELKYRQQTLTDEIATDPQTVAVGPTDHNGTASLLLDIEIAAVKDRLLDLRDNLDNGLDTYADAHAADPEGSEAFESPFIARVAEFADRLDNLIVSFHPKETPEATLVALFHPLDSFTIELESLFELDQQAVLSMGITFDDVTAETSSTNVRDSMRQVWEVSLPLLDHRVNKITMRRRLTALESIIGGKSDTNVVNSMETELRRLLTAKADQKELLVIASKKVSLGELQRLKDQLMKQIVSIRGFEYNSIGNNSVSSINKDSIAMSDSIEHSPGSPRDRSAMVPQTEDTSELSGDLKQLAKRFDILHSFHEDLAAQCTAYVPRDEVEQALRALLGEMKLMKGNSISPELLRESLKTKASATEVQKLVAALTGALGDIAGKTDVAAAVYSKCLICDKPTRSLNLAPLTSNKGPRGYSSERVSTNQYSAGGGYYEKSSDMVQNRPYTMGSIDGGGHPSIGSGSQGFSAWGPPSSSPAQSSSPSPSYSSYALMHTTTAASHTNPSSSLDSALVPQGLQRSSTDDSIIRNQLDLPPLQGLNSQIPTGRGRGSNLVYKQQGRIRAQGSAGGGTGPSYSLDTR